MENTTITKTTKGTKIRINSREDLPIRNRSDIASLAQNKQLIEYETSEEFTEAFPKNKQQFLIAQEKDEILRKKEIDLETELDATEPIINTAIGIPTPYMEMETVEKLKKLQRHKKYYILKAGSESECKKHKRKINQKRHRNEKVRERIWTFIVRLATAIITLIFRKLL